MKWSSSGFCAMLGLTLALAGPAVAQPVKAGEGAYLQAPRKGDKALPAAPFRSGKMLERLHPIPLYPGLQAQKVVRIGL